MTFMFKCLTLSKDQGGDVDSRTAKRFTISEYVLTRVLEMINCSGLPETKERIVIALVGKLMKVLERNKLPTTPS